MKAKSYCTLILTSKGFKVVGYEKSSQLVSMIFNRTCDDLQPAIDIARKWKEKSIKPN